MKVVGLLSGGKDSCYNLCHCVKQGHELVALATLAPPESHDELDSYMYQTVGHDAVHLVAQAFDLPLYRRTIAGTALHQGAEYGSRQAGEGASRSHGTKGDETEDLYELLLEVKRRHPDVEAVSVGAILSNYQRVRVEHVSLRAELKLLPLSYLWQRDQSELLSEMVTAGVEAVLIKVAGIGLDERCLGRSLAQMQAKLENLHAKYGAHVCGEGGEYETLTLDCPLFKKRIKLQETETVIHSEASFASVSYLRIKKAVLVDKDPQAPTLEDVKVPALFDRIGKRTHSAASRVLTSSSGSHSESDSKEVDTADSLSIDAEQSFSMTPSFARQGRWLGVANVMGTPQAVAGARSNVDGVADSVGKMGLHSTDDLEAEVAQAFQNLKDILATQGLSLPHIAHINLYLSDQSLFPRVNAIYIWYFGAAPPSRACVGVLPVPTNSGFQPRVRLDVLAFDDGTKYGPAQGSHPLMKPQIVERKALHVQGRSYWAPANIGPYSQAITVGERISVAGQIGLLSTDLTLPGGSSLPKSAEHLSEEVVLSLQHARRILRVVQEARAEKGLGWVEGCLCWLDAEASRAGDGRGKSSGLLRASRAAWNAQLRVGDGSDEDYEEDEEEDESSSAWLGILPSGPSPPVLFVSVPSGALPRSAAIEWQLAAHTGRAVSLEWRDGGQDGRPPLSDDDDDEDDEGEEHGEAGLPHIVSGRCTIPIDDRNYTLTYRATLSKRGGSSFGIVQCRRSARSAVSKRRGLAGSDEGTANANGEEAEEGEEEVEKRIRHLLSRAFSIRAFYAAGKGVSWETVSAVLHRLTGPKRGPSPESKSQTTGSDEDSVINLASSTSTSMSTSTSAAASANGVTPIPVTALHSFSSSSDSDSDEDEDEDEDDVDLSGAGAGAGGECEIALVWMGVP